MKKLFLLFTFALMASFASANNPIVPPAPNNVSPVPIEKLLVAQEETPKPVPEAQCTYCSTCNGLIVCVSGPCGAQSTFDGLYNALCGMGCCYGNG